MSKQYVPIISEPKFDPRNPYLPMLTYWNGVMGLAAPQLFIGGTDETKSYVLSDKQGALYLCREVEQPDPEDTVLEHIATALERIAESLGAMEPQL